MAIRFAPTEIKMNTLRFDNFSSSVSSQIYKHWLSIAFILLKVTDKLYSISSSKQFPMPLQCMVATYYVYMVGLNLLHGLHLVSSPVEIFLDRYNLIHDVFLSQVEHFSTAVCV